MTADLVLAGGPILRPDGTAARGLAVAVTNGRVSSIGPAIDVLGTRDAATEVVDLAGRLLLPGFVDAHAHPLWGGLEKLSCDLLELPRVVEAYQAAIAAAADADPMATWVTGGGWSFEAFPGGVPTACMIDAVVPHRPVVLFNRDHHGVWVNTRALDLAGVDAGTPDPAGGRIERDRDGRPSGVLHEGAAILVTALVPAPSDQTLDAALVEARAQLLPLGVTGWAEAIMGEYAGQPDPFPAYLRAWAAGSLDVRTTGALWWDRDLDLTRLADLGRRRSAAALVGVQLGSVKIMADGIVENQTAAMLADYLEDGRPSGNAGLSFVSRAALLEAVSALDAAGFGVHVHAIGDRAVREALDAIETARCRRGPGAPELAVPHQIAHVHVVDPDDVPRFGRLGVVANVQALWACHEPQMDEFTIPVLGERRSGWQYPFAGIERSGARLALGSDWPVSSADPWQAIHVAVTRTAPERRVDKPLLLEQALSLSSALQAATSGSAHATGLSDLGRLVPGARADMVIASVDPFAVPTSELADVHSDVVLLAGEVVAQAGRLL